MVKNVPELLKQFTFLIVPHINPDGEVRNLKWIEKCPDPYAFIQYGFREKPGRDLEFGYPDMRIENLYVANFIRRHSSIDLHMSLHGMAFSEGLMLLIERHWIDRTAFLQKSFFDLARQKQLPLHDHDRKGEKGFLYIGPGFTTTPEGQAMKHYFLETDCCTSNLKLRNFLCS